MNKIPVIIDCDPGVDDTLALMLAHQMEELDIKAITTVAGNAPIAYTFRNGRNVMDYIGAQVPVYKGAEKPLLRTLQTAAHIHGEDGMGGVVLPASKQSVESEAAWDAIHRIAAEEKGELTLIAVGPMTNIAIALSKYEDMKDLIKRIVIMGGAAIGGNVTPCAEFNIYEDPEAAEMMFTSGIPVYMCGLDVTMEAYMSRAEIEKLMALGSKEAKLFHDVEQKALAFYDEMGRPGVALHDPTAVLFAAYPELFQGEWCGVHVETKGKITSGKTVTDLYSDKQFDTHNTFIVTKVDREAFVQKIFDLMANY
ncbi:nucleoside hydrolase [Anaerotignum sp.]